jgi:hypothetical protein
LISLFLEKCLRLCKTCFIVESVSFYQQVPYSEMGKHCLDIDHQKYLLLFIKETLPRLNHENSNSNSQNLINEQYLQMLAEYLQRLESTIQEADPISHECTRLNSEWEMLAAKIIEIRQQLRKLNEVATNGTKLLEDQNEIFMDLKRLIDEIRSKSAIGPVLMDAADTYTWKVNILLLLNDNSLTIHSGPFQCSQWGYRFGISMTAQIDEPNSYHTIAVSFAIFRGEYDAILHWPFSYPITLCLVDLDDAQNHIIHSVLPDSRSAIFGRPSSDANTPYHITRFCPVNKLVENGTSYVRDGYIFVRMHTDFTGKGVHPFQPQQDHL